MLQAMKCKCRLEMIKSRRKTIIVVIVKETSKKSLAMIG